MKKQYIIGIIVILVIAVAAIGAYALLSDDNKAEKSDVFYIYVQTEPLDDSYDSTSPGKAVLESGFWVKGTGDNVLDAIENACEANSWSIHVEDMAGGTGKYMSSLFDLSSTQNQTTHLWTYWVFYTWDEQSDSFRYSELAMDDVLSGNAPQYVSLVYKAFDTADDVPPSVTPNDIPSDIL